MSVGGSGRPRDKVITGGHHLAGAGGRPDRRGGRTAHRVAGPEDPGVAREGHPGHGQPAATRGSAPPRTWTGRTVRLGGSARCEARPDLPVSVGNDADVSLLVESAGAAPVARRRGLPDLAGSAVGPASRQLGRHAHPGGTAERASVGHDLWCSGRSALPLRQARLPGDDHRRRGAAPPAAVSTSSQPRAARRAAVSQPHARAAASAPLARSAGSPTGSATPSATW